MSRGKSLLVISLVKVDKKRHTGEGGGGLKSAEKVSRIIWMAPKYTSNRTKTALDLKTN